MQALGIQLDTVRLVGGGSKNPLWCRILADVLETPIIRVAEPESAALGAAIQAYWTRKRAGGESASIDALAARLVRTEGEMIQPNPQSLAAYRDARERLRTLTERMYF